MLRMGWEDLPSQFPFVWPCFTFHVGELSMHWAQLGVCDRMILATRFLNDTTRWASENQ